MEKEQFLKEIKFKKKWLYDKSGFWYERTFKTKLGKLQIVIDLDDYWKDREIGIMIDYQEIKSFKYSEKKILEWIDYLEKL